MTIEQDPLHIADAEKIVRHLSHGDFELLLQCIRAERDMRIIQSGYLRSKPDGDAKSIAQAEAIESEAIGFEIFLKKIDEFRSGRYNFKRIIIKP